MKCFFCGHVTTQDRYCEGCTTYICEDCGGSRKPRGKKHNVHMHLPLAVRPK